MDEEQSPTEAPEAAVPPTRRPRPWMIIAGGALVALVIAGVVVAVVLPRPATVASSIPEPNSSSKATPAPTSIPSARPSPTPSPTVVQPEVEDQPVDTPDSPPQAAPPPAAPPAPVDPGPPALPAPPPPIIMPTITTFTATNWNDPTKTIAQGCAASPSGELAIRVAWATENTTPPISFRTQVSGSPPIDVTVNGFSVSGNNHFFQLRCSKIAYVTMTFRSENQDRQARLTIDGNGPAGWSYLN